MPGLRRTSGERSTQCRTPGCTWSTPTSSTRGSGAGRASSRGCWPGRMATIGTLPLQEPSTGGLVCLKARIKFFQSYLQIMNYNYQGVAYSEILDAHIDLVCTKRGIKLVDESKGFDYYLLDTPVNEIYAEGLLRIKRELLLALTDKDKFSTKLGGKPDVYEKYQRFAVSYEEADWHGLSFKEALQKQSKILAIEEEKRILPDKIKYRRQLVERLRTGKLEDLELMEMDSESSADQSWLQNKLKGAKKIFR